MIHFEKGIKVETEGEGESMGREARARVGSALAVASASVLSSPGGGRSLPTVALWSRSHWLWVGLSASLLGVCSRGIH